MKKFRDYGTKIVDFSQWTYFWAWVIFFMTVYRLAIQSLILSQKLKLPRCYRRYQIQIGIFKVWYLPLVFETISSFVIQVHRKHIYRIYSNRSRPSIILELNFPRLLLELLYQKQWRQSQMCQIQRVWEIQLFLGLLQSQICRLQLKVGF